MKALNILNDNFQFRKKRETEKEGRLMEPGKAFIDQHEQMFFCFSVNISGLLCI